MNVATCDWINSTMRDTGARNAVAKSELEALGTAVLDVDVTSDASVDAAAHTVNALGPDRCS